MTKSRYWTFIIYPESVRQDYIDYLQKTGLQYAISPLHNKDKNPTGENKKEHYHVLVCFNGPTTYKNVNKICEDIGATIPQVVYSTTGIIRYFTHKDNPEKAQYNEEEIKTINGLDIKELNALTNTQIEVIKRELIKLVRENDIKEYRELIDYLIDNDMKDWFEIASKHTIFFKAYIGSRRYEKTQSINKLYNLDKKILEELKKA